MQTVYLNHAGTSWPKPAPVSRAVNEASSADPAIWPELFATAHQSVAGFFHVEPSRMLLTPSCTAALQLAVADHAWRPGDRVLTSHFEHHAMTRALRKLEDLSVEVVRLRHSDRAPLLLENLEDELKRGSVRMVAMTAACNVTGRLLPVADAIALAHRYGAIVLIDGAQTAGWWDLDLADLGVDLFTFAGHKGPQGPWGVGGLYVRPELPMACPSAVCDLAEQQGGSEAAAMPGYCDAGSANLPAIAGLAAACQWLAAPAQEPRLRTARQRASQLAEAIREMPGVTILHDAAPEAKMPTVALSLSGQGASPGELAQRLRDRGLIASAGIQCAPDAHRALGTSDAGALRFSFGPCSPADDAVRAGELLAALL